MSDQDQDNSIALHLDPDYVRASDFARGVVAFIDLVKEISKSYENSDVKIEWSVRVREGSNEVEARIGGSAVSESIRSACLSSIEKGIASIEQTDRRPERFTDKAIERAKRLSEVVSSSGGYLRGPKRKLSVSSQTAANADKILGTSVRSVGSVEGELVLISDVKGPQIGLIDRVTNRLVRCDFGKHELDGLSGAFHKRVSVHGVVSYRRTGEISKVVVEDYKIFDADTAPPSAAQVKGILREH